MDFVLTAYNYAKLTFKKYSSQYSKQKYTQPQLFAILAYKTYNKYDYRNIIENLNVSTKLQKALNLKTIPHYTTIQKFFKKLPVKKLNQINTLLLQQFPLYECYFSLDGTGFTNSYSDIYYNNRTKKTRRSYIKNHITVDSKYMLIRHHNATKGPKYDINFAISAIRAIRCYKPIHISR
ncbi:transposase [Methanosphaera sp. BMS]|uniref:transposase n=1 Tax=Methanosphaera sp. BMS TaxID=1789762 RepID=UPI0013A6EAE0|nr:transposase [Methanosphaera sp. BMS]